MAGAGYRLFNTGDVLTAAQVNTFLQEQVVMRFANAAARTTALSGVLAEGMMSYLDDTNAVQVYNGSAWVNVGEAGDITAVTAGTGISGGGTSGDVTITNSMATAIDAKGDLIAGTGDNAFSRIAAGANGETLVADSSTSTGLRWQADWNTGKNKVINGAFDFWQRGTSFTNNGGYTADRFDSSWDGSGGTTVISQQTFTPGAAPVAGYEGQFFYRWARTVTGTSMTVSYPIRHKIEDVRTLAGQTVTTSFWAKADASRSINLYLTQVFGTGGSAASFVLIGTANLTTSWQRFTFTTNLASVSGKTIGSGSFLQFNAEHIHSNTTHTFDFWGLQIEAGSVATPFTRAAGTLAGELAAARRYFQTLAFMPALKGVSTTEVQGSLELSPMRTSPTGAVAGALRITNDTTADYNQSSGNITLLQFNANGIRFKLGNFTGLTSGTIYAMYNPNGTDLIQLSAEL